MPCDRIGITLLLFTLSLIPLSVTTISADEEGGAGPYRFRYSLKQAGEVSAGIYAPDGRLVRTLLRGELQKAGKHSLRWDGLDRYGQPQPPGEYTWKILRKPPFRAEFLMQVGVNPGSEPYHFWIGNHGGSPGAVAVDATGVYMSAGNEEIVPAGLKQSLDGTRRYWAIPGFEPWTGAVGLGSDGRDRLYWLQPDGNLRVVHSGTGKKVHTWDLFPQVSDEKQKNDHDEVDVAVTGQSVVVTFPRQNKVKWLSTEDGTVQTTAALKHPAGIAAGPNDEVYVSGAEGVFRLARDAEPVSVVEKGLENPGPLAYDAAHDQLLVVDAAPIHQVKRFNLNGNLIETYGRRGGRENGRYRPEDFLNVEDIAADGEGGFLVRAYQTPPRRTAHFNEDGEVIDEWYGGTGFFTWSSPDPRDPSRLWYPCAGGLVLAQVDYDGREWSILEVHRPEPVVEGTQGLLRGLTRRFAWWRPVHRDGREYLICESPPRVLLHENGCLKPVVVGGWPGPWGGKMQQIAELAGQNDDRYGSFLWTDANGDHRVQGDEIELSRWHISRYDDWGGYSVQDDGSLLATGCMRTSDQTYHGLFQFPVQKWQDGVPHYNLEKNVGHPPGSQYELARLPVPFPRTSRAGAGNMGTLRDREGSLYALFMNAAAAPDTHGIGTFPSRISFARLVKWDAAGELCWNIGRTTAQSRAEKANHLTPRTMAEPQPGYLHAPAGIIGEIQDCIVLADRVWFPASAWTKDGLYAGYFLGSRAADGLPDPVYHWWRGFRGPDLGYRGVESLINPDCLHEGSVTRLPGGEIIWFAPGRNSIPVYRIHGWEGWTRKQGTIELKETPPHARADGEGLIGRYYSTPSPDFSEPPVFHRMDRRIWFAQQGGSSQIDGRPAKANRSSYYGPAFIWNHGPDKLMNPLQMDKTGEGFAIRWRGRIEAPLSEPFTFSTYARGGVRLWIDGRQVLFGWNESRSIRVSGPIKLQAGRKYDLQLDYFTTSPQPAVSLNWESPSLERRRIPPQYLYPAKVDPLSPTARDATRHIEAETFDETGGNVRFRENPRRMTLSLRRVPGREEFKYVGYGPMDFGDGVEQCILFAKIKAWKRRPLTIEVRLDGPDGRLIGAKSYARGASSDGWKTLRIPVEPVSGVHDVYIVPREAARVFNLRWLRFE